MKSKTKKINLLKLTILTFFIFGGGIGLVANGSGASGSWSEEYEYVPLAPIPGTINSKGETNLSIYIPAAFNLAIGAAGVIAFIMIVIGGIEYITTDAIEGKSDGKKRISDALWGLLLVLVSWLLLHTINPKLTIFDLSAGDITINNVKTKQLDTSNPYENKGASATGLEQSQPQSNSSVSNKFKQPQPESSTANKFQQQDNTDYYMHSVQ